MQSNSDGGGGRDDGAAEVDVLVIGAGQAGLGTAYWLRRRAPELSVLLVDRADRVGQSWIDRWDSLRLFTPRRFSALPGAAFPAGDEACPDRLEMADYLQGYAGRFGFDIRLGTSVQRVRRVEGAFRVTTSAVTTSAGITTAGTTTAGTTPAFSASHVVVATGPFHDPMVPEAAARLGPGVRQRHSYDYRRPADLPGPAVTVVGGANSAAQLALELEGAGRQVTLVAPRVPWYVPARVLGLSSYDWMSKLGLLDADADGVLGRYIRRRGDPVFGRELRGALRQGRIQLLPHPVVGAEEKALRLADGTRVEVSDVLWCTGFRSRYDWLEVPGALDRLGRPRHDGGASPVEGLSWMGLPWQTRVDSSIIVGVDGDARRTAERIAAAMRSPVTEGRL